MSMLHQPPVDQDDARGRRVAGLARAGALLALVVFVIGTSALMGRDLDRNIAQVMPLSFAVQPAALQAEPAITPAQSMPDVPTATQPTEQDESQQNYVTHGG